MCLFVSDYFLTIASAGKYRARAKDMIVFEGSFEITPYHQRDVDSLRWFSPRFLVALALTAAFLVLLWWVALQSPPWPEAYLFALGAMVLLELAVHMRHLRNLFLFTTGFGPNGITGRIAYPRQVVLRLSAFELAEFAGLYIVLFVFTRSWFVLGGAASCLAAASYHWRLARGHVRGAGPAG